VEFQSTVFCGMRRAAAQKEFRDNVYTSGAPDRPAPHLIAPPQDEADSVLLPTAMEGPAPSPGAPSPRASRGGGGVVTLRPSGGGGPGGAATLGTPKWVWILTVLGVLVVTGLVVLLLLVVLRPSGGIAATAPPGPGPLHPYAPRPQYGPPPPPPPPLPPREPPPLP
jgi:hypothetical protein